MTLREKHFAIQQLDLFIYVTAGFYFWYFTKGRNGSDNGAILQFTYRELIYQDLFEAFCESKENSLSVYICATFK